MKKILMGLCMYAIISAGNINAAVVSFTPSGTSTVSQGTDLYWDMFSSNTSTSSFGAVGDFSLTDHGDFHFAFPAKMVSLGTSEGGDLLAFGSLISGASDFGTASTGGTGFIGTTDYSGEMIIGDSGFFGLSFLISGATHYGWVEISEQATAQSILGWGYESVANQAITAGAIMSPVPAPAPVALWLLGVSLIGLIRMRKKSTKLLGKRA